MFALSLAQTGAIVNISSVIFITLLLAQWLFPNFKRLLHGSGYLPITLGALAIVFGGTIWQSHHVSWQLGGLFSVMAVLVIIIGLLPQAVRRSIAFGVTVIAVFAALWVIYSPGYAVCALALVVVVSWDRFSSKRTSKK